MPSTETRFDPEALKAVVAQIAQSPKGTLSPLSVGFLVGGNGMDAASTIYGLSRGAEELNPLLGSQPGAAKVIGMKALATVAQYLVLRKLAESHPKLANGIAKGAGIGLGLVGAHNFTQAR